MKKEKIFLLTFIIFGLIGIVSAIECSESGKICGGIAGIACCEGGECLYESPMPDASGICVTNETCTSQSLTTCCKGTICTDVNFMCESGTKMVSKGCDKNCNAQVSCEPINLWWRIKLWFKHIFS